MFKGALGLVLLCLFDLGLGSVYFGGCARKVYNIMIYQPLVQNIYMGVSKNNGTPKSSILIGFGTIIFTIHFGGKFYPYPWKHPYRPE